MSIWGLNRAAAGDHDNHDVVADGIDDDHDNVQRYSNASRDEEDHHESGSIFVGSDHQADVGDDVDDTTDQGCNVVSG